MVVRPSLPVRSVNPYIDIHRMYSRSPHHLSLQLLLFFKVNATHLPPIKYQILNCQGKDILVRAPALFLWLQTRSLLSYN